MDHVQGHVLSRCCLSACLLVESLPNAPDRVFSEKTRDREPDTDLFSVAHPV